MTLDKRTRERLLAHCAGLEDDDAMDPREFFREPPRAGKQDRKARQLCHQVAETLALIFSGELDDELLHGLEVVAVDPAPNTAQLAVTLRTTAPSENAEAILDRLAAVAGRLRSEVAAAITRRRAPKLTFRLVGPCTQP